MTDDIYYQYFPMIRAYVAKIVKPDNYLRTIHKEILADAESYAYAYFAELKSRFSNDEEVARY